MNMAVVLRYLVLLVLMSDMTCGQMEEYTFLKTEVAVSAPARYAPISEVSTRSKLDCSTACTEDASCSAFGYNKPRKVCYVFNNALDKNVSVDIAAGIADVTFYNLSLCENGGKRLRQTCECVNGFVGLRCERLMTDCSEGFGIHATGVYQIQPEGAPEPFQVKCLMNMTGQTVVQWHHHSNFSFNRTWEDFRTGFGNRGEDHWIGNENLYWLTHSRNFSLYVAIKAQGSDVQQFNVGRFTVGSETTGYVIDVDVSPTSPNCLSDYNGSAFLTYDLNATNCAAFNGSGWWYNSRCSDCNLNGRLYTGNNTVTGRAVWNISYTPIERIVQTEMTLILLDETTYETTSGDNGQSTLPTTSKPPASSTPAHGETPSYPSS